MHYLSKDFINSVYETLQESLDPDACIPGVENLFADGSPCDNAYAELYNAYMRLLVRLNLQDEDFDIEIIINSLFKIAEQLSFAMYTYGAKFALASLQKDTACEERCAI